MATFCVECADEENGFHEIIVEDVPDRESAEEFVWDEFPGVAHIFSISEVR